MSHMMRPNPPLVTLYFKRKQNKGGFLVMTEVVFILDRSGSMAGLEADTIGGFNSTIRKQ